MGGAVLSPVPLQAPGHATQFPAAACRERTRLPAFLLPLVRLPTARSPSVRGDSIICGKITHETKLSVHLIFNPERESVLRIVKRDLMTPGLLIFMYVYVFM